MRFDKPVMDMEYLRKFIPAAFANSPRPTVSSSFAHINTATVVQKMLDNGFVVARAQQKNTRTEERRQFTRHLIAFRKGGQQLVVGDYIPEFVLVNAHDGTTAYNLYFGIFRVLCANGLVVGNKISAINIPHRGDVAQAVLDNTFKLVDGQEELFQHVERMRARELLEGEQHSFANKAMCIRYDSEHPFNHRDLLKARREQDAHNNLWSVLNRIQENLMKGGQEGKATSGRKITTRPIERVTKDVIYNRKLWDVAESYL